MKTLVILAQKGGSGKTTIAVHMAVCAVRLNFHTALIDLDPQGSASDWNDSREEAPALKPPNPFLAGTSRAGQRTFLPG